MFIVVNLLLCLLIVLFVALCFGCLGVWLLVLAGLMFYIIVNVLSCRCLFCGCLVWFVDFLLYVWWWTHTWWAVPTFWFGWLLLLLFGLFWLLGLSVLMFGVGVYCWLPVFGFECELLYCLDCEFCCGFWWVVLFALVWWVVLLNCCAFIGFCFVVCWFVAFRLGLAYWFVLQIVLCFTWLLWIEVGYGAWRACCVTGCRFSSCEICCWCWVMYLWRCCLLVFICL